MTAQHTPIPWTVHTFDLNTGDQGGVGIVGADGATVADNETYYPHALDPANAEFIVRAVNSHALILEALKAMTGQYVAFVAQGAAQKRDREREEFLQFHAKRTSDAIAAIRAATGEDA